MTNPQGQQMGLIPCLQCGVLRGAISGVSVEAPGKLSIVGSSGIKALPCPVCSMAAMIGEMREHIMALEAEITPKVEEAAG